MADGCFSLCCRFLESCELSSIGIGSYGACAFELSSGGDRIIVNCGAGGLTHQTWNWALRATAAHSTLTVADTNIASVREMLCQCC